MVYYIVACTKANANDAQIIELMNKNCMNEGKRMLGTLYPLGKDSVSHLSSYFVLPTFKVFNLFNLVLHELIFYRWIKLNLKLGLLTS